MGRWHREQSSSPQPWQGKGTAGTPGGQECHLHPPTGYSHTTMAGSCSSGVPQSWRGPTLAGPPEGTARLHLHPDPPLGTPHPSGQSQIHKGPWSHRRCDSSANGHWREISGRRGLFPAGHSVPPPLLSLSPPASPSAMEGASPRRGAAGMAGSQRCHRSGDADFPNTARSEGRRSPGTANSPAPANQQPVLNWHISAWLGSVPRREPRRCWQPWPPVPSVGTGTEWGQTGMTGATHSVQA